MAVLYDQFGREITVEKRPETREISVTTIRDRWSGYPSEGLTPQRLAGIFKEADQGDVRRQAELFEEMEEKDTHLFSQLQTRKNAVLGLDYDFTPWTDSAEDKAICDFVSNVLLGMEDFEEALLDLLDALGKGYALSEIIWAVDGGRAVVSRLEWIHAKKAVFYREPQGEKSREAPRIATEEQPIEGEQMPPWKLVYHRYKARSGYDTRAGLLRICAWMYLFKNYSIKDWVSFAEVFGMPLRLGKYDAGASRDDKDSLVRAIRSLGSDAAGIISKNTEIEFVEAVKNAGTNNVYETLAKFCDAQMSKAILGQTATTEGTPGRLGNEDAQDLVRHDLLKADAEALSKTVRFQLIRPLVGYNFGWDKPLPWFKLMYERPEDLEQLSAMYKNLHAMGQPISQEHVADRFKVPLPAKGETVLAPPETGYSFGAYRRDAVPGAAGSPRRADFQPGRVKVAANQKNAIQGDYDGPGQIVERLAGETGAITDSFVDIIRRLVNDPAVRDLSDLRDRLVDLWDDLDPVELGTLIARATAVAELAGMADVKDDTGV